MHWFNYLVHRPLGGFMLWLVVQKHMRNGLFVVSSQLRHFSYFETLPIGLAGALLFYSANVDDSA